MSRRRAQQQSAQDAQGTAGPVSDLVRQEHPSFPRSVSQNCPGLYSGLVRIWMSRICCQPRWTKANSRSGVPSAETAHRPVGTRSPFA